MAFTREDSVLVDPSGTKTAHYWTGAGTHTGVWDPPGLNPTGRRFQFRGATFLESHDGKLRWIHVVYDVADIMRQLGVLPVSRSGEERLMIMAANLRSRLRRR